MSFKKKLFTTIGPLVLAFGILGGIFLSPFKFSETSPKVIEEASTSMAVNVIKGNILKNKAMGTGEYVPFFGSSELSRFNAFHPSVLATKYDRNYRPFLLGAAGTQSLSQFLMLQSMADEMVGKKAVFIISPQWFVKGGVSKEMFSLYFSPLQTYQWAKHVDQIGDSEIYTAKRLLKFSSVRSDTTMKTLLSQIAQGKPLSTTQKKLCQVKLNVLNREDELFGHLGMLGKQGKIKKEEKLLPANYDLDQLDKLAFRIGEDSTKSNKFQITDNFYKKRIVPVQKSLKGSQKDFDYRQSPEFGDFQLFLAEVARLKMDVLFVIPPVNARWSEYTGLSTEMLDQFSLKINKQLKDQGFDNVLDFTQDRGEDYFMEDTIHIGWRGWVALDKVVAPFLAEPESERPNYHLNSYYFSKEWKKLRPSEIN